MGEWFPRSRCNMAKRTVTQDLCSKCKFGTIVTNEYPVSPPGAIDYQPSDEWKEATPEIVQSEYCFCSNPAIGGTNVTPFSFKIAKCTGFTPK